LLPNFIDNVLPDFMVVVFFHLCVCFFLLQLAGFHLNQFLRMSCVETYVPKSWRAPAHQNSYSFRQMTDDARTSEFWIKMHTTKTATAVSNSYNFSLASVSFPKGRSAASVSVKVVYEFACCLFVGVLHCSQSPLFSLAAVCCFSFNFFSSTYG
jgi:hypothetical protein